jgi:hypothetical protein
MSKLLLNLDELNLRHEKSEQNRTKLFDEILMSCHNKIKKYNKDFKKQECLFAPPPFIVGKPPYNFNDLTNYLMESLRKNGLRVEWLPQKASIYVSWKPIDVDINQYHQHFSDTVYSDDFEQQLTVMTVRPKREPATTTKKKKTNEKPVLQHVAMVEYGMNTKDLIPINVKGLQSSHFK